MPVFYTSTRLCLKFTDRETCRALQARVGLSIADVVDSSRAVIVRSLSES